LKFHKDTWDSKQDPVLPLNTFLVSFIKKGSKEIINIQQFDQIEKYLTGTYDVDVLCLPRLTTS